MRKPDWKLWMKNPKECKFWLDSYVKRNILLKSLDESGLYLKKTNHNLNFANWVMEKHKDEIPKLFGDEKFYDWIISVYYYAIYHSALALVSKECCKSRSHSATLCFLIYHHYHTKKSINEDDVQLVASSLSKEDIETIGASKELREKACYDVHSSFEKRLAEHVREETVTFVNKIKGMM